MRQKARSDPINVNALCVNAKVSNYIEPHADLIDIPKIHFQNTVKSLSIEEFIKISATRDEAIYKSYTTGMYSMKEIGKYFGLHYSRVSKIIKLHFHEAKGKI